MDLRSIAIWNWISRDFPWQIALLPGRSEPREKRGLVPLPSWCWRIVITVNSSINLTEQDSMKSSSYLTGKSEVSKCLLVKFNLLELPWRSSGWLQTSTVGRGFDPWPRTRILRSKKKKKKNQPTVCVCISCSVMADPPGFSIHEIFQTRILEWVAISWATPNHLLFQIRVLEYVKDGKRPPPLIFLCVN